MHKQLLLTVIVLCVFNVSNSYAKTFRVGYLGKPVTGIDFAALDNTVITAASPGDTIQLYENNNMAGTATVNKKLVILGFGFLLDKNPGLQATPLADYQVDLSFTTGSDGSVLEGLNVRDRKSVV